MMSELKLPISLRKPTCVCIDGSSQLLIAGGIDKNNMAVLDMFAVDFNEWKKSEKRGVRRIGRIGKPHVSQQAFLEDEGEVHEKRKLVLYDKDYTQEVINFEELKEDEVRVREVGGLTCLGKAGSWWACNGSKLLKQETFKPS